MLPFGPEVVFSAFKRVNGIWSSSLTNNEDTELLSATPRSRFLRRLPNVSNDGKNDGNSVVSMPVRFRLKVLARTIGEHAETFSTMRVRIEISVLLFRNAYLVAVARVYVRVADVTKRFSCKLCTCVAYSRTSDERCAKVSVSKTSDAIPLQPLFRITPVLRQPRTLSNYAGIEARV